MLILQTCVTLLASGFAWTYFRQIGGPNSSCNCQVRESTVDPPFLTRGLGNRKGRDADEIIVFLYVSKRSRFTTFFRLICFRKWNRSLLTTLEMDNGTSSIKGKCNTYVCWRCHCKFCVESQKPPSNITVCAMKRACVTFTRFPVNEWVCVRQKHSISQQQWFQVLWSLVD